MIIASKTKPPLAGTKSVSSQIKGNTSVNNSQDMKQKEEEEEEEEEGGGEQRAIQEREEVKECCRMGEPRMTVSLRL